MDCERVEVGGSLGVGRESVIGVGKEEWMKKLEEWKVIVTHVYYSTKGGNTENRNGLFL